MLHAAMHVLASCKQPSVLSETLYSQHYNKSPIASLTQQRQLLACIGRHQANAVAGLRHYMHTRQYSIPCRRLQEIISRGAHHSHQTKDTCSSGTLYKLLSCPAMFSHNDIQPLMQSLINCLP